MQEKFEKPQPKPLPPAHLTDKMKEKIEKDIHNFHLNQFIITKEGLLFFSQGNVIKPCKVTALNRFPENPDKEMKIIEELQEMHEQNQDLQTEDNTLIKAPGFEKKYKELYNRFFKKEPHQIQKEGVYQGNEQNPPTLKNKISKSFFEKERKKFLEAIAEGNKTYRANRDYDPKKPVKVFFIKKPEEALETLFSTSTSHSGL